MLEKYGHGGDLLTAAELYGENSGGFLDFSANINPLGPPPGCSRCCGMQSPRLQRILIRDTGG